MEWLRRVIIRWINAPIQTNTQYYIIKDCVFNRYWYHDNFGVPKKERIKFYAKLIENGEWENGGEVVQNENKPEKAIYVCPKCNEWGLPSTYGDYCTNCSNIERGFYGVQKVF